MENLENTPALTDPYAGYEALKGGVALVSRSDRSLFRIAGKDPIGMLNAILTNEAPKEASFGVYAALLNPKGRIQADLRVLKAGEEVLIDTEPEGAGAAQDILGRYAPFSRVKLENLSDTWNIIGLYGPRAGELLGGLKLAEHESARVEISGATLLAAGVAAPVPGFDLLGPADVLRWVRDHLLQTGAVLASLEAYETARIEAGIPRFGVDISPENFPGESESFLERAVSFQKGCYPGQETVARMRYRGHPNKRLYRFAIDGPPPPPNSPIVQNEKQVGRITSTAPLPTDGRYLALGYLSRNARRDAPLSAGEASLSPQVDEKV